MFNNKSLFDKQQAQFLLNLVLNTKVQLTVGQASKGIGLDEPTKDIITKLQKIVGPTTPETSKK